MNPPLLNGVMAVGAQNVPVQPNNVQTVLGEDKMFLRIFQPG
jgi:hypothetical protein